MITLLQNEENLIGSEQAINELKTLDHARVLTISDSHGNYNLLIKIVRQFGPSCNALIFCGDGARDIAELLEVADENEEFKKCVPPVIAFVRGNGDSSTVPVSFDIGRNNKHAFSLLKGTVVVPLMQTLTVNSHNILITHGHYQGVDFGYENLMSEMQIHESSYAVYGHTHVACTERQEDYNFINPGSISRPRASQPPCFAILTVEKQFIDAAFLKISDSHSANPQYSLYNPVY
ncbi:MAG: metallophosphoesterase family protein [Treponema sp.]|nr:metallophosphoesterase family protein [Treponema sp.]